MDINLKEIGASLSGQFQGLAGRHPGLWPLAPRLLCAAGVMAAVIGLGYFGYWSSQFDDQERLAQTEQHLREEYRAKMAQAINLEALQAQKVQVDQYVERLQKQLPSKAEMAALLSDINQAGVGRGLPDGPGQRVGPQPAAGARHEAEGHHGGEGGGDDETVIHVLSFLRG